ncbi:hypothetical protein [Aureimonas ureilytica]|uniref:hypothetical protein n=1 Tax=Aureimonas ureilytica TaxID=401562 RepID=UPI0003727ABB|nr:hypothetical protein [Aureimonas ureilytica]
MLAACLRSLVVILSLVAVAAFAGHGTAMAGMSVHDHPVAHSPSTQSAHAHGEAHKTDGGMSTMSCCGKSCTSILPFPAPSGVSRDAHPAKPDSVLHLEEEGILPPGLKRPPKLA